MSVTGAAILLVVIWFLTLFTVIQVTTRTQGEAGEVVAGTHEGAPADFRLGRTLLLTTLIALPIWGLIAAVVLSGLITVRDLDFMGIMEAAQPN